MTYNEEDIQKKNISIATDWFFRAQKITILFQQYKHRQFRLTMFC